MYRLLVYIDLSVSRYIWYSAAVVYFLFLEVYGGRIEVFWGVDGMRCKEGEEGFYRLEVRCWCDDVCGCVCGCVCA